MTTAPSLRDQAEWDEGILDTAARIEATRPLTVEEFVELDVAYAEFCAELERIAHAARAIGGKW